MQKPNYRLFAVRRPWSARSRGWRPKLSRDENVDLDCIWTRCGHLRRLFETIGIDRKQRDVTHTLDGYLETKYGYEEEKTPNIIECMEDPALFGHFFKDQPTWTVWKAIWRVVCPGNGSRAAGIILETYRPLEAAGRRVRQDPISLPAAAAANPPSWR